MWYTSTTLGRIGVTDEIRTLHTSRIRFADYNLPIVPYLMILESERSLPKKWSDVLSKCKLELMIWRDGRHILVPHIDEMARYRPHILCIHWRGSRTIRSVPSNLRRTLSKTRFSILSPISTRASLRTLSHLHKLRVVLLSHEGKPPNAT